MKPVIAIVGRPNVGKSTLFNRLTRSRDALVADFAGLTRDRHYGNGRMGDREFICIDTGGFEPVAKTGILAEMAKQTKQAVVEADIVIFLVDARLGMAPQDRVIADFLRKTGRPVILAVNKAEGMSHATVSSEFYELGLGEPQAISSAHGDDSGVRGKAVFHVFLNDSAIFPRPFKTFGSAVFNHFGFGANAGIHEVINSLTFVNPRKSRCVSLRGSRVLLARLLSRLSLGRRLCHFGSFRSFRPSSIVGIMSPQCRAHKGVADSTRAQHREEIICQ